MLYSESNIIQFLSILGNLQYTRTANYIPTINEGNDIDCTAANISDDCVVECVLNTPSIPNVYCGDTVNCIINCTNTKCLHSTNIHANNTDNLYLTSSATACTQKSNVFSPNNGNATIIGNTLSTNNDVMKQMNIYSGISTDRMYIECIDGSNTGDEDVKNECSGIYVDAKAAKYLKVDIKHSEWELVEGKDATPSIIECPVNSTLLTPSCIINATNAYSTNTLQIFAENGSPNDVVFYGGGTGDYTGTSLTCNAGTSSINTATNTFIGQLPCWLTAAPTYTPTTSSPTISSPTTSSPTTSSPTTSSPTTSSPTYTPTTSSPATSSPTYTPTYSPTSSPTTSLPTLSQTSPTKTRSGTHSPTFGPTMYGRIGDIDDDNSLNPNVAIYGGIGAAVFIIFCLILGYLVFIVYKRKNKLQCKDTTQTMDNVNVHTPISKHNVKAVVIETDFNNINTNNEDDSHHGDSHSNDASMYRKQSAYMYEEDCGIEGGGDICTPLPSFEANLHHQISSVEALMTTIVSDMNESHLKLEHEMDYMSNAQINEFVKVTPR